MGKMSRAWVTLLTRTNYIAGAVLLAHSLQKHKSKYPLIILYTPSLPKECLPALRHEVSLSNAILRPTEALIPKEQRNLIAARFEDTWTKLRTFELFEYERLVFLDADMLVFRSMDELFDLELPGRDWIAANHCCVCNLDKDEWAPDDWVRRIVRIQASRIQLVWTILLASQKTEKGSEPIHCSTVDSSYARLMSNCGKRCSIFWRTRRL